MLANKIVTVIVPAFNEEENIVPIFKEIDSVFHETNFEFQIVFIDDGSQDGTVDKIELLRKNNPNVSCLSFTRNFGHQLAITAGLDAARGDVVIMMDADLQHPPSLIKEMLNQWQQGYQIVYTIRKNTHGVGVFKKLMSRLYYHILHLFTGFDIPSGTADFRLFDRHVVEVFKDLKERHRFFRGLTHWVGFKSIGITYEAQARRLGKTKYNFTKMANLAIDGICSFSIRPLVIPIFFGLILSTVGGMWLLYTLLDHPKSLWPPIILLIGGIQFIFIGILGLYVGKIFEEIKGRPLYILQKKKLSYNSHSSSRFYKEINQ